MHIPSTHILSLSSLGFHGPHQELYTDLPDVQQAPGMGGDDMHEKAATDESLARVRAIPVPSPSTAPKMENDAHVASHVDGDPLEQEDLFGLKKKIAAAKAELAEELSGQTTPPVAPDATVNDLHMEDPDVKEANILTRTAELERKMSCTELLI